MRCSFLWGGNNHGDLNEGFYYDHHLVNVFFSLAIEVNGCFYEQSDNFFINVLTWHG
jgi:hypothetical protein